MQKITLLFLVALLTGCGPAYHLRKAERHIAKAKAKGAVVSYDTIIKPIVFTVPKSDFKLKLGDITIKTLTTDTIYVPGKTGEAKVRIDTVTNTVFVECPEQEVKIEVPVAVTEKIEAGHGFWTDVLVSLISIVAGAIAMFIYRTKRNLTVVVNNQKEKE